MGHSNIQQGEDTKVKYCSGEMNGNLTVKKVTDGTCCNGSVAQTTVKLRSQKKIRRNMPTLSLATFVVECILSYAVLIFLSVCLVPLLVVYNLLKYGERILVKVRKGGIPLSGQDALWQQGTKENPLIIHGLLELESSSGFDKAFESLRQAIKDRMVDARKPNGHLLYPRCRYCIRPGYFQYFFQEDKSFRIENHVFKWNGDVPSTKAELESLVSKMSSEMLPQTKPPWCFCCVPTNYGARDMAVVFKMSHSVADGVSITRFVTSQLPDVTISEREPRKFSSSSRASQMAKAMFITPRYVAKRILAIADQSILHGPEISGVKKVVWHQGFDLKTIKEIKTATHTTVNDVLMSCLSLALQSYFKQKGLDGPQNFTASIPIDVRSSSSRKVAFENNFAVIFLNLPVGTDGVLENLFETKARMDQVKISGEPLGMAAAMYLTVEFCPEFVTRPLNTFITRKSSCVLSNVPGPQHLLSLKDITLKSMTFWPPQRDNIALGLSIYTYGGKVIVGVQSDVTTLPDPEIITEEFGNAVEKMAKCVLQNDFCNGHK